MKKNFLSEIIGWYGAAAILCAYGLSSFGFLTPDNPWYQLLNASGAIGIVINVLAKHAYPPAVLNIIWALIAIVALVRAYV